MQPFVACSKKKYMPLDFLFPEENYRERQKTPQKQKNKIDVVDE
jgi:hypothetical protein